MKGAKVAHTTIYFDSLKKYTKRTKLKAIFTEPKIISEVKWNHNSQQ